MIGLLAVAWANRIARAGGATDDGANGLSSRRGHANVSITLDIYSHAMSRQDEETALDVASVVVPREF